jgi:hypothetical protein
MAAESADFRKTREFNLYSLQLVTGELWTSIDRPDRAYQTNGQ